jgi:serine/threonine protein kinase
MDKSDESTVSNWEKQQYDSVDNQNEFYQNIFQASKTSHYKSCYEEIAFIGEGGYGKVYRARNKFDDEYYAVKKILISGLNLISTIKITHIFAKNSY